MSDLECKLERMEQSLAAAHAEMARICDIGGRAWTMSIPPRPDADSDYVIGRAIVGAEALISLVRTQAAEIERLKADISLRSASEARLKWDNDMLRTHGFTPDGGS